MGKGKEQGVEDVPIPGHNNGNGWRQYLLQSGGPAYVRRAQEVDGAWQSLLERLGRQRDELLGMVRTRLGLLHALAGDWPVLQPWLADEQQIDLLRRLHDDLHPRLRAVIQPTESAQELREALLLLQQSIERFNRRWQEALERVDLTAVNERRESYNRYYLLEKECALRSSVVARLGFRKLLPLTTADLRERLPLLPVPHLRP
jgi:hypothetical protein